MYLEKYNIIEKVIGTGQRTFEKKNGDSGIEIDIADIFFAYGFLGLFLFLGMMLFLFYQVKKFKKSSTFYPYASLIYLMLFILLGISTIAGHVYSSGMSAVFIGLLFSLMYLKEEHEVQI